VIADWTDWSDARTPVIKELDVIDVSKSLKIIGLAQTDNHSKVLKPNIDEDVLC
jgi:hypothetical protein